MDAPPIEWYGLSATTLVLSLPLSVVGLLYVLQIELQESAWLQRCLSVFFAPMLGAYYVFLLMSTPPQYLPVVSFGFIGEMIGGMSLSVECALQYHGRYAWTVRTFLSLICISALLIL
jgi:hypothetical protein